MTLQPDFEELSAWYRAEACGRRQIDDNALFEVLWLPYHQEVLLL